VQPSPSPSGLRLPPGRSQIRSTKSEIRNKFKLQKLKIENEAQQLEIKRVMQVVLKSLHKEQELEGL
jgi:hypothetical protein